MTETIKPVEEMSSEELDAFVALCRRSSDRVRRTRSEAEIALRGLGFRVGQTVRLEERGGRVGGYVFSRELVRGCYNAAACEIQFYEDR